MNNKKMVIAGLSVLMAIMFVVAPIMAASSIILVPIETISNFFADIGDFIFGDGSEGDEIVYVIQEALNNSETKEQIHSTYGHIESEYPLDESIPYHYLVTLQFLAGLEFSDVNQEILNSFIEALITEEEIEVLNQDGDVVGTTTKYKLNELPVFVENIRQYEPFKTKLSHVSDSTLISIINGVGSIEGGYGNIPQEILDKYKGRLLYPLLKWFPMGDDVGWYDPFGTGELIWHRGADIQVPCGEPVFAMDDAKVLYTDRNAPSSERGNYVIYESADIQFRNYHFRSPAPVNPGQEIKKGDLVGYVGTTGNSTGCHLHIETRIDGVEVSPTRFIKMDVPE